MRKCGICNLYVESEAKFCPYCGKRIYTAVSTEFEDEEVKLNFVTHVEDNDFFYDEIGSELMIKKLRQEKQDFWESLELYYKIFLLGEDEV